MATAKFSDFTAVLGSNLASGDLLLVSRVGGGTSAKLSMSELRSYLDGFYSALAHTHAAAAISGLGSAATVSASTFAAASHTHSTGDITGLGSAATVSASTFAAASHTHSTGDITGLGSAATVSASTFAAASHTHAFSDIGVGTTSGVGFGMSAGSSTASGAVLNIQGGTVGKSIETFDETSTSRFSVSTYGIVSGRLFSSSVATGTAPLIINSTTACTNLNADLLDGSHASAFSVNGHTHGLSSLTGDTYTAGQYIGGTGAGGLLAKGNAGTVGQCLGWTTGGVFTAITPGTGSGVSGLRTKLFDAPAARWRGVTANIPEPDLTSVAGMTSGSYGLSFDSSTTETAQLEVGHLPTDTAWNNASVAIALTGHAFSATSGTCQWVLAHKLYTTGAWTGAFTSFATISATLPGNTGSAYTGSYIASTSSLGWTGGQMLELQLTRLTTGSATHAADSIFHGITAFRVEA